MSIQDVRPNSQDTTTFYLVNINQVLADPNRYNFSLPSSPPTFSPPTYAVLVNERTLVLELGHQSYSCSACDLATAVGTEIQHGHSATSKCAHASPDSCFFSEGVERFLLPWVVKALHTLLHLSLYLFFAGLIVFMWNINLTIFRLVLSWVSVCSVLYGCFTFMPIIRHDSPYRTPLSSLA